MRWALSILFFITLTLTAHAQEFNAGFVQGLWYSDQEVFADTPTRIYVAVRNNTDADLTGTVEFFVDGVRIERSHVSALSGRIVESWADWKPAYGEHTISASLSRTELHQVGSSTEQITIISGLAEDIIFVDLDTDADGIGNEKDTDDDNDGHSDKKEKEHGSDPLDLNDPIPEEKETDANLEKEKTTDESRAKNKKSDSDSGPAGLEQYLTDSRADHVLTSMTNTVNTTKKRLDAYRVERYKNVNAIADESGTDSSATTSPSDMVVTKDENGDSFGEVERVQTKTSKQFPSNFTDLVMTGVSGLYTFVLFGTSFYLGHPVFVQLSFLILILFILFKTARKLGSRHE